MIISNTLLFLIVLGWTHGFLFHSNSMLKSMKVEHKMVQHHQKEPEVNPTRRSPDEPVPYIPVRLPTVDSGTGGKMDVNSCLLQDRIIMIGSEVNDEMANAVVAQLLYLANNNPNEDITMYINSPGGSISSGMAIFDTMQFIPCNISTICFGMAASMGAFLLGKILCFILYFKWGISLICFEV